MRVTQPEVPIEVKYPDSAGIDIGKKAMFVAVFPSVAEQNLRSFSMVTAGLKAIAVWLRECRVTYVAMEATRGYWIPLYEWLE